MSAARAEDRPYLGEPVDEGSSSQMTFALEDPSGTASLARDIMCWVDDARTKTRLYGPILPTPAVPVTVTLPPQANQIVTDTVDLEAHTFTCHGRYPAGCVPAPTPEATPGTRCLNAVGEAQYLVRNVRAVVAGQTPQASPAPTSTPGS